MQISKKNILNSSLFLLGLLTLVALASLVFQPKDNKEQYGMEETKANGILGEPEQTLDVLFIGDSVSYTSIIPTQIRDEYGITSYVCGTPMQDLYYSKEFLNKALEKQSPKIVFLGTATIFNDFTGQEKIWNSLELMMPVFRYHNRWKNFWEWPEWKNGFKKSYTYQDENKGYKRLTEIKGVVPYDYPGISTVIEWIPYINRITLNEIKKICEEHGAQLILLSEPNATGSWSSIRHNALVGLAEKMELTYIDLNYMQEEVPIDWMTDTADEGDHLNENGAKKVSTYMGKYLKETGLFEGK